jgi:N-acyl amino acid synthase of PEP-CTERM/exosortase system
MHVNSENDTVIRRKHFADRFQRLVEEFHMYFQVVHANTRETREDAYRIRHQVYCEEFGWEPRYETGMEVDEFDAQSAHVLLKSADGSDSVGSMRLVRASVEGKSHALPIERALGKSITEMADVLRIADRGAIAEISRLAIVSDFRRRRSDAPIGVTAVPPTQRPDSRHDRFPFLTMGLYLGGMAVAQRQGLRHFVMLMEPKLSRHLNVIGFVNHTIGAPIEHHGVRIPAMFDMDETLSRFRPPIRALYDDILHSITPLRGLH